MWIGLEGGVPVRSELNLDVPDLGPVRVTVIYGLQPRLQAWLPAEDAGADRRGGGPWRLDAVAKYSDYRKAEVEVQEIVPIR